MSFISRRAANGWWMNRRHRFATGIKFRGGARALRLQSLCPFRATAEQRLACATARATGARHRSRARAAGSFTRRSSRSGRRCGDSGQLHAHSPEERRGAHRCGGGRGEPRACSSAGGAGPRRRAPSRPSVCARCCAIGSISKPRVLRFARSPSSAASIAVSAACHSACGSTARSARRWPADADRLQERPGGGEGLVGRAAGGSADAPVRPRPEQAPGALSYALLNAEGCRFAGVAPRRPP